MTPSRIIGTAAATAALATVGLTGVAGAAAGDKTFQQTFPVASNLCAKVTAGTEGRRLKLHATEVLADCTALQSAFTTAQTTVLAARAALAPQIAAEHAAIRTACPLPTTQTPACHSARKLDSAALKVLHAQKVLASRHYYSSIEEARKRFWSAIKAFPGERHIKGDVPVPIANT
jgi:hypothetical protein